MIGGDGSSSGGGGVDVVVSIWEVVADLLVDSTKPYVNDGATQ